MTKQKVRAKSFVMRMKDMQISLISKEIYTYFLNSPEIYLMY